MLEPTWIRDLFTVTSAKECLHNATSQCNQCMLLTSSLVVTKHQSSCIDLPSVTLNPLLSTQHKNNSLISHTRLVTRNEVKVYCCFNVSCFLIRAVRFISLARICGDYNELRRHATRRRRLRTRRPYSTLNCFKRFKRAMLLLRMSNKLTFVGCYCSFGDASHGCVIWSHYVCTLLYARHRNATAVVRVSSRRRHRHRRYHYVVVTRLRRQQNEYS